MHCVLEEDSWAAFMKILPMFFANLVMSASQAVGMLQDNSFKECSIVFTSDRFILSQN